MILTPCKFRFDVGPYWDAFDTGWRWGGFRLSGSDWKAGFGEVAVSPMVLSQIVRWFDRQAKTAAHKTSMEFSRQLTHDLSQLHAAANGLIYLKKPWMITIVEPAEVA